MEGAMIRSQASHMDRNSLVAAAIGGAGVLAAMWWWHRRSKAKRVTPEAKGKSAVREENRARKLQKLITDAEKLRDEGQLQHSAEQYLAAVKLASKYFGKVSMPLLRALQSYSVVLFALDRPAAVLTVLTQCVYIARRLPQYPHSDRVSLMLQLGDALIRTNRHSEAEKVIIKALEILEQMPSTLPSSKIESATTPGGETADTATPTHDGKAKDMEKVDPAVNDKKRAYAFWNLALIKSRALDRTAAEDYAKKAVQLFQTHFGKAHSDTLSAEVTLATVLYDEVELFFSFIRNVLTSAAGQKSAASLLFQTVWGVAQSAFAQNGLAMNVFLGFAHLLAATLVEREENSAAEQILTEAINAPQLPKRKPLQFYRLLSDLAAIYWETEGREDEAKELEDQISNTLTSVADHLPLSSSRTMRVVRATLTATGVFLVDFSLNAMLPASREPLYHISPEQIFEIRFENPSNPKERVLLKRKVGQSTFVSVHSPLLNGFRHSVNYIVDISVRTKDGKLVGRVRQLVRYVAQFVLPPIVPGSPDETFAHVTEEIRVSQKAMPNLIETANPKEIAKEEEALTKLLLQLDNVTDEKHREHRKALVDTVQQLLHKIDATKASRTSD